MGADPISATMAFLSQAGPTIAQGAGILQGAGQISQMLGGGQQQQQQQSQFPRIGVDATMYPISQRPSQSRDLLRMRSQMPADLWQKLEQQGLLNSF